jgi:RNA polymerase primary sigma factor
MADRFNDECLEQYYRALSRVKIMSADEEKAVFTAYQSSPSQRLRKRITESCLKLVFSLAKNYWKDRDPETLKSLISAGNVGLLEAIDKFDLTRGSRFSSYASFWILMHIRNELTGLRDVVKPSAQERKRRMLSARSRARLAEEGRLPAQAPASYTSSFQTGAGPDLPASIAWSPDHAYAEIRKSADLRNLFGQWRRFLRGREQYVLERYYGLGAAPRLTLREVAANLRLSSERVRQIKEASLAKLHVWLSYEDIQSTSDVL